MRVSSVGRYLLDQQGHAHDGVGRYTVAALIGVGLLFSGVVGAASIQVSSAPFLGSGIVDNVVNGNCSLVEAIRAANTDTTVDSCAAGNGADTVILPSSLSTPYSFATAFEDQTALPLITSAIEIVGNGSVIRRSGTGEPRFRIFQVNPGGNLTLTDLTVSNGDVLLGITGAGGGLLNRGQLTLDNVTVTGNTALLGGGVANHGTLQVVDSTISNNSAGDFELEADVLPRGDGGGIHNDSGQMSVIGSTLSANIATRNGGGINTESVATISNTTISGNTAGYDAGGVYSSGGQATLTHSTVAFNTGRKLRSTGRGDGFTVVESVGTVRASIITGNQSGFDVRDIDADVAQANFGIDDTEFNSLGDNVVTNFGSGTESFFNASGDMPGVDPQLDPLADSGGPTQTHALAVGSPAINAADVSGCPARDQRGVPRPVAADGEACDIGAYEAANFDFGDARFPFPVWLEDDGAAHVVRGDQRPILGTTIDTEADGQPSTNADGDGSDEDGVIFPTNLVAGIVGGPNQLISTATVRGNGGRLNAWIDFDGDGEWADPDERVITNFVFPNGPPNVDIPFTFPRPFQVPADAALGLTTARIRLSSVGNDAPTGIAADGEVEDYTVTIDGFDFGDAPNAAQSGFGQDYPTLAADSGASHRIIASGPSLTTAPDAEGNGQPSANADGDNSSGTGGVNEDGNDEQGIVFSVEDEIVGFPGTPLPVGATYSFLTISPAAPGLLNGWIDFNQNGDWDDVGEQVVTNFTVSDSDVSQVPFAIPGDAALGTTYARFRISSAGSDAPTGPAADGEVEDYWIILGEGAPPAPDEYDFGDAPDPGFATLLANDGARHVITTGGPVLGGAPDSEDDALTSADASGDDNSSRDDEDGVQISSDLIIGETTSDQIQITTTGAIGLLNVWIDLDGDGSWNVNNEHVVTDLEIMPGTSTPLTFDIPDDAQAGDSFARFRLSTAGDDAPTGSSTDGEVEDYPVTLVEVEPTVTLSIAPASFSENVGSTTVTAQLDRAFNGGDVTVVLGFDGIARLDEDYSAESGSIVIPAGETTGQVVLTGIDDDVFEGDETIAVGIDSATNASNGTLTPVSATLTDDETAPVPTFAVNNARVAENGAATTLIATLSRSSANPTTIDLTFAGTADNPDDYTVSSSAIVIAAGETEGQITLTPVDDDVFEGDETVIIGDAASAASVNVTIEDNEIAPTPKLTVVGSPFAENAGIATVTATLSGTSTQQTIVELSFGGSASAGDYDISADQITIAPGETTGQITLTGRDDDIFEGDETVTISTEGSSVDAVIADDEAEPTHSLTLVGSPFAENGGIATVTATLSGPAATVTTVDLDFGGTAAPGDFNASAAQIVIVAGDTTGEITLTGVDDNIFEADETVVVSAEAASVSATITDDENAPTTDLTVAGSPLVEAGGVATVTATLSGPTATDTTISLSFGGTASPSDYNASANQISIAAGDTTGQITLTGVDDNIFEGAETITLSGDGASTSATIIDDDPQPTNNLAVAGSPLSENGGIATFTISLSGPAASATTVDLVFGGTASSDDYTASANQVVIAAGETNGQITVTGVDDAVFEGDETVTVSARGATASATITDNEIAPDTTLSVAGSPFSENAGVATITATQSGVSATDTVIELDFSGTAAPSDYAASSSQIVISAGQTSGQITLTGIDDNLFEGDESVIVTGAGASVTATITDNEAAPATSLTLADSPLAEAGGVASVTATLSGPTTVATTINLTYAGTASTSDYTVSATQIVIPAGQTSSQVTLTGVDDAVFEGDETISISGAGSSLTATIIDDEGAPGATLEIDENELSEGAGAVDIRVQLTSAATGDTTVVLSYGGSATRGADFTGPDSVVVPALATQASFQLTVTDDLLDEPVENIQVTATPSGAPDSSLALALLDNDDPPQVTLALDKPAIAEDGGSATVTATLNQPSSLPVSISMAFAGQAERGVDYIADTDALSIPAGQVAATLSLAAIDDFIDEPDESIAVTLTEATNAKIGTDGMVTTVITDDDGTPSVSLATADAVIAENAGQTQIIATLSNPASENISINLALGGPGVVGIDFELADTRLTFSAGATEAVTTLTGLDDSIHEPDELIVIAINDTGAADTGLPASISVALTDDDDPEPGAPTQDQSGPVVDVAVDAGTTQVPVLAFGLRNPAMEAALIYSFSAVLVPAPTTPLVGRARLYLDSNSDGQIQDGEPLVAETTQVQADGIVVFALAAPLTIDGGQTLNLVVIADTDARETE